MRFRLKQLQPALTYATYGRTMDAVVPAGLKTGGANLSVNVMGQALPKTLTREIAPTTTSIAHI